MRIVSALAIVALALSSCATPGPAAVASPSSAQSATGTPLSTTAATAGLSPTPTQAPTPSPTPLPASVILATTSERLAAFTAWKERQLPSAGIARDMRADGSVGEGALAGGDTTVTRAFESPNRSDEQTTSGTGSGRSIWIGKVGYSQSPIGRLCGQGCYANLIDPGTGNAVIDPATGRAAVRGFPPGTPWWTVLTAKQDYVNVADRLLQLRKFLDQTSQDARRESDIQCGQGNCYAVIVERTFDSPSALARRVTDTWLIDSASFLPVSRQGQVSYLSDGKGFATATEYFDWGVPNNIKPPEGYWP